MCGGPCAGLLDQCCTAAAQGRMSAGVQAAAAVMHCAGVHSFLQATLAGAANFVSDRTTMPRGAVYIRASSHDDGLHMLKAGICSCQQALMTGLDPALPEVNAQSLQCIPACLLIEMVVVAVPEQGPQPGSTSNPLPAGPLASNRCRQASAVPG